EFSSVDNGALPNAVPESTSDRDPIVVAQDAERMFQRPIRLGQTASGTLHVLQARCRRYANRRSFGNRSPPGKLAQPRKCGCGGKLDPKTMPCHATARILDFLIAERQGFATALLQGPATPQPANRRGDRQGLRNGIWLDAGDRQAIA